MFAATRAQAEFRLAGSGSEFSAALGCEAGDDEELGGELAVVEQGQQRGIGFRDR